MLKEKLTQLIQQMPYNLLIVGETLRVRSGGVCTMNFPGLILMVSGYHLQGSDEEPRLPLNAPLVDKCWMEYEEKTLIRESYLCGERHEIAALGRQLWAREYGDREAEVLPFYMLSMYSGNKGGDTDEFYWGEYDPSDTSLVDFFNRKEDDDCPYCFQRFVKDKKKR